MWLRTIKQVSQSKLTGRARALPVQDQHYLSILNQELYGAIKSKTNLVRTAYLMAQQDSATESNNPYFYLWINSNVNIPFVRYTTFIINLVSK